jgi:hypothetical protein
MRFCPFCSAENADDLAVCQSCGRRLPPLPPRRARNAPPTGVQLPPRPAVASQPPPLPMRRAGATIPPQAGDPPRDVTPALRTGIDRSGSGPPAASGPPPSAQHTLIGPPPGASAAPAQAAPFAPPGQPVPVAPAAPLAPPGPPAVLATSMGFAPLAPSSSGMRAPAPVSSAPRDTAPGVSAPPALASNDARALANALSPGPAAQRREAAPAEPGDPAGNARRRSDGPAPVTLTTSPGTSPPAPRPIPGVAPSGPRPAPETNPPSAAARMAPNPDVAPDPPWATGYPRAPVGYIDPDLHASALAVGRRRADLVEPPPTRIHRAEALVDRPFTPPTVSQVPGIPEPGLVNAARYAMRFAQARWQRRGAIKLLGGDIKKDTDALDQVLGALGGVARTAKVDGRVFSGENAAITAAEDHAAQMAREHNDVDTRKLEENARFVEVERERNTKLGEAEHAVDEAQKELAHLEGQRRALRDSRKELERRQKAYLKAAEDSEKQAGATETGEPRQDLRRSAEQHRREAAAIEPERQEADRGLTAIERPIAEAIAKLDAAKAELDAAKRSLADAREGHTHRLAELDAEQKRKAREIAQAEAEIARRLVTLGTLVNLNRIDDPQFEELYQRIDRLRGAITARATEIEKLTAEREAYDRGNLVRGVAVIGGAILLFIALIVILRALLLR